MASVRLRVGSVEHVLSTGAIEEDDDKLGQAVTNMPLTSLKRTRAWNWVTPGYQNDDLLGLNERSRQLRQPPCVHELSDSAVSANRDGGLATSHNGDHVHLVPCVHDHDRDRPWRA